MKILKKSAVLNGILWLYDNVFDISLRTYGLFLLAFSVVYEAVLVISGGSGGIIALSAAVFSAVLILLNISLSAMFKNSVLIKKIMLYFGIDLEQSAKTVKTTRFCGAVF